MTLETVALEIENGVAVLALNRPDTLNAFNPQMIADTRAAIAQIARDPAIRAVLLTGRGRGFSSGADLADSTGAPEGVSVGQGIAHSMETTFNPMMRELMDLGKPVVAAVNGIAAGGGVGFALTADIVFAARSASFVQVFAPRLGLVPDLGCTWLLPRLVGHAKARGLTMLGDRLSAEDAERWGLIWKCVDDSVLMDEARAAADRLAKGPTKAFSRIKTILDKSWTNTFEEQLELEKWSQRELGDTADFREGTRAFLEKREPVFRGE